MIGKDTADKNQHEFFTFPELQAYLGLKSRKTLLKYITSGKLQAYKIGGTRWRIARKDLDTFLEGAFVSHK